MIAFAAAILSAQLAAEPTPAPAPAPDRPAKPAPSARPSDEAVRKAISATLVESGAAKAGAPQVADTSLRSDELKRFATIVADAKVPHCLHSEGLKRQPTGIGPFGVSGYAALPFVLVAAARGKCNW
ncbi:MAG: hypothetical protein V4857_11905 [Pseudomonadota bacterium]